MAGDPIYDCTPTTCTTDIYAGTTSTTATYCETVDHSVTYTIVQHVQQDLENNLKKEIKTIPKFCPSSKLIGVCFGGLGWAYNFIV